MVPESVVAVPARLRCPSCNWRLRRRAHRHRWQRTGSADGCGRQRSSRRWPGRGWLWSGRWRGLRPNGCRAPSLEPRQGRTWRQLGAFSRRPRRYRGGLRGCAFPDGVDADQGISRAAHALSSGRARARAPTGHRHRSCAALGEGGHRRGHRQGQGDFEEPFLPAHDFGKSVGRIAAAHLGSHQLPAPVADAGLILATPHLQRTGQHILLAVAHDLDQRALGQISLGRAGLGQRPGLWIGQAGVDEKTGSGDSLQRCHRLVAARLAGKGVVNTASQQVHLSRRRIPSARREHADAARQGGCREHDHELVERTARPLGHALG